MAYFLHKNKLSTARCDVDSSLYFEHGLVNQLDSADSVTAFIMSRLL